jgi:hypothetical protein
MFDGLLVTLAASLAMAQQPSPAPADIVVTGNVRLTEEQAEQAVSAISNNQNMRIARFREPVCPMAIGLAADSKRVVEQEIRRVAVNAGAQVGPANCSANLILIVANDTQAMFSDIRAHHRPWIAGLGATAVSRLARESGPVLAWTSTTLRNEDGDAQGTLNPANPQSLRVQSSTILGSPTRQQIDGAVIIVDRTAAVGKTLSQLAHYAAMRGLAQTRPPAVSDVDTILNLFAPGAGRAAQLTSFDQGYLKAVYASQLKDTALIERTRIARSLARGTD